MTIQDDSEDTRPVTKTTLTKAEIMNALGFAAALKNGLTGEYNMIVRFQYDHYGELVSAEIEQRSAPAGSTGQPPLYRVQGLTVDEAAAGYGSR
jgi:hypothetical protein